MGESSVARGHSLDTCAMLTWVCTCLSCWAAVSASTGMARKLSTTALPPVSAHKKAGSKKASTAATAAAVAAAAAAAVATPSYKEVDAAGPKVAKFHRSKGMLVFDRSLFPEGTR